MARIRTALTRTAVEALLAAACLSTVLPARARGAASSGELSGESRKWHKVTVTFAGPRTSEEATPNPFLDYRLEVTFTHGASGKSYTVPGYYAADGNAARTGATAGDRWRVHFAPDEEGAWEYSASFRKGKDVAVRTEAGAGSVASFDGARGSFKVAPTDKTGRDHRAKGMLRYVGEHYLRFAETGEYFIKGGADSPENFLGYADFDGTSRHGNLKKRRGEAATDRLHRYAPHVRDWRRGDPTWRGGKGKGIIGALNYLSSKGMNSVYFLTMNVKGDGKDVWPWTSAGERFRFDCSKLDQWEIVFSHMDRLGLMLHVITQETEIDTDREFDWNDRGGIGRVRKLYYRELVARFGHHLAVTWNLGEENTNTDAQRKLFADRLKALDPYDHPVVVHTYPGRYDKVYGVLLGHPTFDGPSLQMGRMRGTHSETGKWVNRSAADGRKWIVCLDEIGPASVGVEPDSDDPDHDQVRKDALWGNLMAGGAGCEWYFGYKRAHNDLNCEDWRSRDRMWDQTRYALEFFQAHIPFTKMRPDDGLVTATGGYCFALPGVVYAIYLKDGGTTELDLGASTNTFTVEWYDPRKGGRLQKGTVGAIRGPGRKSIGRPPREASRDWAALVKVSGSVRTRTLTVTGGAGAGSYPEGAGVRISAGRPRAGKVFDRWTGDVAQVADVRSPETTMTIPAGDVTVEAVYRDAPEGQAAAEGQAHLKVGPGLTGVVSFTLIDADTDRPVGGHDPMRAGSTLNLAALPTRNLNIRANTSPRAVGSVRFGLDGKANHHTESSAPYALEGDTAGDYKAWTPGVGSHTLTATPYTEPGARGKAGTPFAITFEVIDDPGVPARK